MQRLKYEEPNHVGKPNLDNNEFNNLQFCIYFTYVEDYVPR
jgi:hypothetical protein